METRLTANDIDGLERLFHPSADTHCSIPIMLTASSLMSFLWAIHRVPADRMGLTLLDVTLGYTMTTLGIDVTNSTVTYQGTTYRDSAPNTTVTVTVNGQPVTPSEYVLQQGDRVKIVVEST